MKTQNPDEKQAAADAAKEAKAADDSADFDLSTIEGKEFTSTLQEVRFTLDGQPHILREMSGTLRDQYNTKHFGEFMERQGDTFVVKKYDGLYANLLAFSIYGPDGKLMEFERAKNLPSSLQSDLYLASRKISKLDRKKAVKDATKNS